MYYNNYSLCPIKIVPLFFHIIIIISPSPTQLFGLYLFVAPLFLPAMPLFLPVMPKFRLYTTFTLNTWNYDTYLVIVAVTKETKPSRQYFGDATTSLNHAPYPLSYLLNVFLSLDLLSTLH